jgi:TolA-binding protein
MGDPCSRLWEIDPYRDGRLGVGDAKSFERHLRACDACRAKVTRDDRLRDLARALPEDGPTDLSLRRLRARVLRDAAAGVAPPTAFRGLRVGIASLAVVLVGASAWAFVAHRARPSLAHVAVVVAPPVGASAETPAAQGGTTQVHVEEGVVDVGLQGGETQRLGPREATSVSVLPTSAPPAHAARPIPITSAAVADGVAPYAAAIALLREGRNDEAASAFHAFVLSQPAAPQAEDASFLEAVALARTGRSDAAALAAEHHLASFPASFHRKDAATLVARAAAQRGDCGKARALLAPWTGQSPDAEAQATLRVCEGH